MKIALGQLLNAVEAFNFLKINCALLGTTRLKISKLCTSPEVLSYYKVREELIKEHLKEGDAEIKDPEIVKKLTKQFNDMRKEEVEIDFKPILAAEFSGFIIPPMVLEGVKCDPFDLLFGKFVIDEEAKEVKEKVEKKAEKSKK